tara:strand:+ start:94 stop:429 length:336 start_codon:yes stop_codon:yes gene_type:complete
VIVALKSDTQSLTLQANLVRILMLGDERIFHFVSSAKKTVFFLKSLVPFLVVEPALWAIDFLLDLASIGYFQEKPTRHRSLILRPKDLAYWHCSLGFLLLLIGLNFVLLLD